MDILKKNLAPVTADAWDTITAQAKRIFASQLTARKFVDLDGPKGWDYGAVPLGYLDIPKEGQSGDVTYGITQVQPLVEIRVPFTLNLWELDNITRGAKDTDLSALEDAARHAAEFEEKAIYYGFQQGGIQGLKERSPYDPVACPADAEGVLQCVPEGISQLKQSSILGPYSLVVNPTEWKEITSYAQGYPLKRQVEQNLDAEIIFCPHIQGMFLVSERGGDFRLTQGVDFAIGYEGHDHKEVRLYFTESFTFQVLEPRSVVVFE